MKENEGQEFIIEVKKFINQNIEEQYNLNKKLNNIMNELEKFNQKFLLLKAG